MKWILFDKDGTIIYFDRSWMKIGLQLVEDFMEKYKEDINNIDESYAYLGVVDGEIQPGTIMASGALDEMVKAFCKIANQDVTQWAQQRSQTLVDNRVPENVLVEGINETLETLQQRGYKMGIVTSDSKKGVEQFLEYTQFERFFDIVISTEADAVEKPNPEVLNSLFYRYEVDPKDVAIVGDTANDIQTGVNAQLGLKIAVLTGVGLEEEFAKADYIFDNVNDIVDVLK
ncbi:MULTISPECIES: HAD family hydrolase [Staphylococcus]|jgi:phosphoglycolate phosphatase|uniref:HAD family hydrolase n=1 Tax=Staphylococcus nepalensis TaxID=214473 RepID=A0A291JNK0_9STAP|nr:MULTISPECIES: HAD family hydrolase [Staphylococcus]VDG67997.1 HAD-superfamily hydrolase [Lacrimispora indolis]ATH60996.1 HAD family hydrolase [Staphylococcus nepalensis]ATH66027.1 HAD family hydrolase [Staphylococcus nepalensis]AWI45417.1 HAD family hydrolase [Staphylococcus nepalensis]MBO1214420.1 HAD family hydrolase [Staphylococcus nepalensis]